MCCALIIFDPLMPTSPRFITFMPPSSKSYKILNLSSSISVFHIIWDVWAFAGGEGWRNGRWGLFQGAQGVVDISGLIVSEKTVSLVPQHPLLMHCKYYYRFLLLFYSNEFQWQQTTSEVILKRKNWEGLKRRSLYYKLQCIKASKTMFGLI